MNTDLIIIKEYCSKRQIDPVFIIELEEEGLIEIQVIDGEKYIDTEQLTDLERYVNWHYDLSVNVAGIDVIRNLLRRIEQMKNEMNEMRNRMQIYNRL